MKNKIIYLIFGMFIIASLILVQSLPNDRIKEYNPNTLTATIKDNFNNKIADIQLKTPIDNIVGAGYIKVAEFEIKPKQDYNSIINNFKFYNVRTGKIVDKQIDIKYKVIQDILVDRYIEDCSNINVNNKSKQACGVKKSGLKTIQKEVWLDFDGNVKSNKDITIGLFTNVEMNEYIEWIPTIANVEIKEFATWLSSLNSGLMHYYKFDELIGTNASDIKAGNNGVVKYNNTFTAGKINNSIYFNYTTGIADTFNNVNVSNITSFTAFTNTTAQAFQNLSSQTSDTGTFGYVFVMGSYDMNLTAVYKNSTETANTTRLRYGGNTTDIATAVFSGDWATFSSPVLLTSGSTYQIVTDSGGSSHNLVYVNGITYPLATANLSFTDRVGLGATQGGGLLAMNLSYQSSQTLQGSGIGNFTENATYGAWFNSSNNSGLHFLVNQQTPVTADGIRLYINDGTLVCSAGNGGGASSLSSVSSDTWNYVLCNKNTTGFSMWLNGEMQEYNTGIVPIQMPNETLYIGMSYVYYANGGVLSGDWFNGEIDELAFWNRSLTIEEMDELYNNGGGCSYQICFINTSISLIYPTDNQVLTSHEVTFSVLPLSPTNATNLNVTYYVSSDSINWFIADYNSTAFNNTQTNDTNTLGGADFNQIWYWSASVDDGISKHFAVNRTLNISIPPLASPVLLANFTNVTLGYDEAVFIYSNLSDYWDFGNVPAQTTNLSMIFKFINPDIEKYVNITTNNPDYPFVAGTPYYDDEVTSQFILKTAGLQTATYQIPNWLATFTFFEDETIEVIPYGCNDAGCTEAYPFYIIISGTATQTTEFSFFKKIIGYIRGVFPDGDNLSNIQKLGIVLISIIVLTLILIFAGYEGKILSRGYYYLIYALNILLFLFFVAIGYVALGVLVFMILLISAIIYFKVKK